MRYRHDPLNPLTSVRGFSFRPKGIEVLKKSKKPTTKELVVEALQRKNVGPLFQNTDSEVFRLAVGSFFASMEIGEYANMLEDQAETILKKANGSKKKVCGKRKYST